jgi:hypothetical protein
MDYDISGAPAELARWQAGVISRPQLLTAGLTSQMIATRLERGRWQQLHWGVYAAFTGPPPRQAWLWAAVLRAGPGAVLSHLTAAELHGLLDTPAEAIFVTVPSTRRISAPGLVVRTSGRIVEATQPGRQPPRTSVEETVLDLAEIAWTFDDACGWLTQACGRRTTTAAKLGQAQHLRKKMRWRHELGDVLEAAADGIHSALDYRYLRDVERAHGLPRSRLARRLRPSLRDRPAPGPDPAQTRLDGPAPAVLARLPRRARVTATIDLRSLRRSRQPLGEVPRLT